MENAKEERRKVCVCVEDQATWNWRQVPDCVIISPSTTARSSARGKDGETPERKKGENQMSQDPRHKQSRPDEGVFFWLARRAPGYQFSLPLGVLERRHCWIPIVAALFVGAS